MSLVITPEILEGMYNYLNTTPPFNKWNLPDGEDVKFLVSRSNKEYGRYQWKDGRHTIKGSKNSIGQTGTLARFMSHEMIHLHLEQTGLESKSGGSNTHNKAFRKSAAQVCKYHGFDLKAFY